MMAISLKKTRALGLGFQRGSLCIEGGKGRICTAVYIITRSCDVNVEWSTQMRMYHLLDGFGGMHTHNSKYHKFTKSLPPQGIEGGGEREGEREGILYIQPKEFVTLGREGHVWACLVLFLSSNKIVKGMYAQSLTMLVFVDKLEVYLRMVMTVWWGFQVNVFPEK